ncbi:MAG TPA: response regulator transcription factor [Anaerolineales bacterium]|nr:response regulator transcription factor [Anaerolineales bacterium]
MQKRNLNTLNVILIEAKRGNSQAYTEFFKSKNIDARVAHTAKAGIESGLERMPDIVILDTSGMRTGGERMVKSIVSDLPNVPLLVVCEKENAVSSYEGVAEIIYRPCTARRLLNAVHRILPNPKGTWLQVGKIQYSPEQHKIRLNGIVSHLTPKKNQLLKLFSSRPHQIVSRLELLKEVWDTEYTGDTRTLDVHISWLRKTLGTDPQNTEILETVRGSGYRLNVDVTDPI